MKIQRTLKSIVPQPVQPKRESQTTEGSKSPTRPSFSDTLKDSINEVNKLQKQADRAIEALSTGETKDIAQTMIAVEKANISFQLMTQIRNRILEAYQEVLRMQS